MEACQPPEGLSVQGLGRLGGGISPFSPTVARDAMHKGRDHSKPCTTPHGQILQHVIIGNNRPMDNASWP